MSSAGVRLSSALTNEFGFLQSFVGKTGDGAETPTYSSENYVATGTTLEAAIGVLDDALATIAGTAGDAASQVDLDSLVASIEGGAGVRLNANLEYVPRAVGGDTLIDGNASFEEDLTDLDDQLVITDAYVDNIIASVGGAASVVGADGAWVGFSNTYYIDDAPGIDVGILMLDSNIGKSGMFADSVGSITTPQVVDSVSADMAGDKDEYTAVKWLVVINNADRTKKLAFEIFAMHDGTQAADATVADWNEYGKLKIGASITGLSYDVTITSTGTTSAMNLVVESTEIVDVQFTRLGVRGG